jgi:hypothetical protein
MLEAKKETNTNLLTIDFIVNEKSVFDIKSFKNKNLESLLSVNAITFKEYEKIKIELDNLEKKEILKKEKLLMRKIKNIKTGVERYNLALKESENYFKLNDKLVLTYNKYLLKNEKMKKINSLYIRYSKSSKAENYFKILDSLSLKIIKSFKIEALLLQDIKTDMKNSLKFIEDYLNIRDIKIIVFKPSKTHLKARCINNHIVNSMKAFYVTEARFCESIHRLIDIENDIKKQKENKLLENIIDDKIASDKLAISNKNKQALYRLRKWLKANNINTHGYLMFNTIKEYKAFYKTL